MAEQAFQFGPQWQGRCFVCGEPAGIYHTGDRVCKNCTERYRHHHFFRDVSDLSSCFVTILPETEGIIEENLHHGFKDLFLAPIEGITYADVHELLEKVFIHEVPLPCGQPALFPMEHLAKFAGLGGTWVLDLSPYIWSGTLKDLRSWAVMSISLAIEHKIKNLALWTAGNAGYSLAKMVHRWNSTVPRDEHKTVYCLVDSSAPPEMVVTLRSLQCRVAPISTGSATILSREQLYHVVSSITKEEQSYWQVTDGWDGVGVFMYSLLARQCFHLLRYKLSQKSELANANIYIILPLGTGNLLLGFVRGMEQIGQEQRAKVVAAVPYGDHMMMPFLPPGPKVNDRPKMHRDFPEAPKLTGFYSPLSPCLWQLAQDQDFSHVGSVDFIEVDRASQIEVAARILGPAEPNISAEPSALIAFGALKQLAQKIRDYGLKPENSVALVVNSGFGIMDMREQEFTKSIFAFR